MASVTIWIGESPKMIVNCDSTLSTTPEQLSQRIITWKYNTRMSVFLNLALFLYTQSEVTFDTMFSDADDWSFVTADG